MLYQSWLENMCTCQRLTHTFHIVSKAFTLIISDSIFHTKSYHGWIMYKKLQRDIIRKNINKNLFWINYLFGARKKISIVSQINQNPEWFWRLLNCWKTVHEIDINFNYNKQLLNSWCQVLCTKNMGAVFAVLNLEKGSVLTMSWKVVQFANQTTNVIVLNTGLKYPNFIIS